MGLVTGAVGGTLGLFMLVPTEVLKCNIQVNTGKFISYKEFIPIIYEKKGIKGFYQGYWATFWRDVPGWAIYFYSYEALKNYFYKNHLSKFKNNESQFKRQEFFMRLFCGGMAGVNSWLLCFPFDVVKTQIQVSILSEQPVETACERLSQIFIVRKVSDIFMLECLLIQSEHFQLMPQYWQVSTTLMSGQRKYNELMKSYLKEIRHCLGIGKIKLKSIKIQLKEVKFKLLIFTEQLEAI
eukprot:403339300